MRKLYSVSLLLLFLFSCSSKVAEQTNIPIISFKNEGMTEMLGTYNDSFISYSSPDILKRNTVQRDDLRLLSEKSLEENNPILCLFKFRE